MPPARAHMNSISPINKVRSLILNKSEIVMMVTWISAPPPTPWSARPAIRTDMLGAVAHMMELTKNHATDTNRMSFLPQMSDNLALGEMLVKCVLRRFGYIPDRRGGSIG
jgi:hypothetical protein